MTGRKSEISIHRRWPAAALPFGLLLTAACDSGAAADSEEDVRIVGSATIEPISRIAVRESGVEADVSGRGTLAGLEDFCAGEADIANASIRMPGSDAPEGVEDLRAACEDSGVEFVELPIGYDALSVIVNTANEDVTDVTMDELGEIWTQDSSVETWSDLRDDWPDEEIALYGRSEDSGTYTHFAEELFGDPEEFSDDYLEEDGLDELAELVSEDDYSMAFMGVGNYLAAPEEVQPDIKTVAVDDVPPDALSSAEGEYPLVRTLYTYIAVESLEEDGDVEAYAERLLSDGRSILPRAFFYPLSPEDYEDAQERLESRETGVDE
ncbi:MAG: substrate-binding domain-containing protein [Nesterenkonia sp.]|uniref:substrate-binding domain-containing protein n=1 Tax=Nesterenkonia marinintestina TaxID=2979865 RepID=UPI0021C1C0B0|nr:substrate-binding domain-containing protein [Nesterenkonia sp. GX14115]MDO5492281.1 substrate-binding domain-containing protein [Nesterenkonia sp.]